jgi:hypothetical protein
VDVSEGEEEEEVVALPNDKYKPASLDKMITLVASLVEKSRDSNMKLQLSEKDYSAVAEGKVSGTQDVYLFFFRNFVSSRDFRFCTSKSRTTSTCSRREI